MGESRVKRCVRRCAASALVLLVGACGTAKERAPIVGLITKTESNPFFVTMRQGADAAARANGFELMTGAGKNDGDNAGQVTALENMVAAGAKTILITVNDSKAIVPAIQKARAKGVMIIGNACARS